MTATIDITADATHDQDVPQPEATDGYDVPAQPAAGRAMIAIDLLTAHPGNVRRNIHLDQEFLDSIAELGILTPLRITPAGGGVYRVIEGHRRLAAAEQLGHAEVPYDLAAEREGDEAGQFPVRASYLLSCREADTALGCAQVSPGLATVFQTLDQVALLAFRL